jgi:pimeloyl-ACP methyl ester carboxylesterase
VAALVLLPAIGLDAGFWEWVELPNGEVHRHEFPGFGRRPRATGLPSMADLADDVAASYDGPLDVVGVSMGGMVAQHLALRHADRVRSLLIACTGAAVDPDVMLERARATEAGGIEGVLESTLSRWFTPPALAAEPEHRGVAYTRRTLLSLEPQSFADAWRTMAGHDVRDRLGEIAAPATCLCGTDDVVGTPERVGELAGGVQNGRFVMREGPHMLPLERPEELSDAIREHLDWVVP